jgi:hypothetical protein
MRHIVPLLSLGLLSGCYLAHGEPGREACGPPLGQVCCDDGGRSVAAPPTCPFACPAETVLMSQRLCTPDVEPWPVDGGPLEPIDAGPIPDGGGPLECPLVRADATCLASWLVAPGVPFELPVTFDTCGCCAASECRAEVTSVDGAPTLRLTTTLCPDPCDCSVCRTPEARCAVPALHEGAWNVVVNGAPAFTLPVFADSGLVPPPPACATYAEPDVCRVSEAPLEASGWRPAEVCVSEELREGAPQTVVAAISDCWTCGDLEGDCLARVEPRFTDDLPPGGEIRLGPTHHATACDVDCPAVCMQHEQRCILPPLTPGDVYRVWADGEPMLTFVAGETPRRCAR